MTLGQTRRAVGEDGIAYTVAMLPKTSIYDVLLLLFVARNSGASLSSHKPAPSRELSRHSSKIV